MSKAPVKYNNKYDRVVVLIDMDCFYCQVEEKLNPSLKGKPIAVVQYNAWKGGGIIAVNYPARNQGVTRHMRGDEAKAHCPTIELVRVPNVREKADLSKYRDAGKEVASVLQTYTNLLERASVDEAYLDITEKVLDKLTDMNKGVYMLDPGKLANTYAVGYDSIGDYVQYMSACLKTRDEAMNDDSMLHSKNDIKLLIGASIVNEIRADVKSKTGYECSAGIAHNKILAKFVCGINKPNQQTILPLRNLDKLYNTLPIKKIKGLGGKFGEDVCDVLQIKLMCELGRYSQEELQKRFDEKNGNWLHLIGKGVDLEPVTPRFASKSIGCCKKFPGRTAIKGMSTLTHWLSELAKEISERLEKDEIENNRKATQMVVSFVQEINFVDVSSSRSIPLTAVDVEKMATDALDVIRKNTQTFSRIDEPNVLHNPIKFLGLNVGKFEDLQSGKVNTIESMFSNQMKKREADVDSNTDNVSNGSIDKSPSTSHHNVLQSSNGIQVDPKDPIVERHETQGNKTIGEMFQNQTVKRKKRISETTDVVDVNLEMKEKSNTQFFKNKSPANCTSPPKSIIIKETPTPQLNSTSIRVDANVPGTSKSVLSCAGVSDLLKESDISPSKDYTQTYAEFFRSPASIPVTYVKCSQCGKNVATTEMLSHTDAHIAFRLSQEQRIEYRSQLFKAKSTPSPPVAKKLKTESKKVPTPKAKPLQHFFVREQSQECDVVENKEQRLTEKCLECDKIIPVDEIIEHMDYHLAKQLQQQLNSPAGPAMRVGQLPNRKKTTKGKAQKEKIKSVATFFTQEN